MKEDLRHLRIALAAMTIVVCTPVLARDHGQYKDVPENIRAWFKSVKTQNGVPCCDIADGHRTDYDMRDDHYWVPINGQWLEVLAEAVLKDVGNSVGDAVVWYSVYNGKVVIRCFVLGGGA